MVSIRSKNIQSRQDSWGRSHVPKPTSLGSDAAKQLRHLIALRGENGMVQVNLLMKKSIFSSSGMFYEPDLITYLPITKVIWYIFEWTWYKAIHLFLRFELFEHLPLFGGNCCRPSVLTQPLCILKLHQNFLFPSLSPFQNSWKSTKPSTSHDFRGSLLCGKYPSYCEGFNPLSGDHVVTSGFPKPR